MKILCVFGQHNYGDPSRGEGYEFANFIPAFKNLGHEVIFFDSHNRALYRDFADLNRALLQVAEKTRPDLIIAVPLIYEVWKETWDVLRDWGQCAVVNWATDDSWKYQQSSKLISKSFHAVTTTYPERYEQYHRDGIRHVHLTQWAANSAFLKDPMPSCDCQYSVSFIGTAHGDRRKQIAFLESNGIHVDCFGFGWPNGAIRSDEIPEIIRKSRISLNFANSVRTYERRRFRNTRQIKARTFEVPGAGGFLLSEWAEGIERYYLPGSEIGIFYSRPDLIDKIHYYLDHPAERDSVARCGHQRTKKEHTYDLRMAELIDYARVEFEEYFKDRARNDQMDWQKFRSAEGLHVLNSFGKFIKYLILNICVAIWGRKKGPRVARRLVFEISWRIDGARTYSSRGIPGRMFYSE